MRVKKIYKKFLFFLSIVILLAGASVITYKKFFKKKPQKLFTTGYPEKRDISHAVSASGVLEIKDLIKVGSNVSGTAKFVYVDEDDVVKQGQLLAEIDPGTGETDFQQALWLYERVQKEYAYLKKNFERQKQLYHAQQISQDNFEKIATEYETKELEVKIAKARLEKEQLILSNRKIVAPGNGLITKVNIFKGGGVSASNVAVSSGALFEVAPDITQMEAKLDIDESDIGFIKPKLPVKFSVSTYPDMYIRTSIKSISFSPSKGKSGSNGALFYKATLDIENKDKKFRPGMAIHAKIKVAKAKNALSIKGLIFQINDKTLKQIAEKINYGYKAIEKKDRKDFLAKHKQDRVKFIWVLENKTFIQKTVVLGVTDDDYFEIKSGITEKDVIVTGVIEEDEMAKIYKKFFSGPL